MSEEVGVVWTMFADDVDEIEMKSRRETWKGEIEEWLERLKTTEKDLGLKERELCHREMILRQREQKLEEQFHVVVSVSWLFCDCFIPCCFIIALA